MLDYSSLSTGTIMALAGLSELRRANWDWGWGAASDTLLHTQWFHSTRLGLTTTSVFDTYLVQDLW